jgi:small multidrug resistance family-3 protein
MVKLIENIYQYWEEVMEFIKSMGYFILAGLFEIGGGYLIWLWLREGKGITYAILGAFILILYGIVPTLQPASFGRVYAAYGGVFVVLSILWGWGIDKVIPDKFDIIGGIISLFGVLVIMYWPRG